MNYHKAAQVLISTRAVSSEDMELPTSDGILDKALKLSVAEGAFSEYLSDLNFIESRVGLRCVELSSILNLAQAAELTQDPNPSYRETQIKISKKAAKRVLSRLNVDLAEAKKWGAVLDKKLKQAQAELLDYQAAL